MKRVKMIACHRELVIGHLYDLPDARADALVAGRYAVFLGAQPETATVGPSETATARPQRERWTLKTSPERYLKGHPNGPNAELARRIIDSNAE
jgi:hypothetical protein